MSYRVRLLILLVCAGLGYFSAKALLTSPASSIAQTSPPVSAVRQTDARELAQAEFVPKGGSLLAEWERLRAKHGSTAAEISLSDFPVLREFGNDTHAARTFTQR